MRQHLSYSGLCWGGLLASCLVVAGCGAGDDATKTPRPEAAAQSGAPSNAAAPPPSAVVEPISPAAVTAPVAVAAAPLSQDAPVPDAAIDGVLYVCVVGTGTAQQRTPIELPASVDKLCRKAPEMGPCQYERELCRRRGGKVYTTTGVEITKQVEAEYDRRVMRIRMKSN